MKKYKIIALAMLACAGMKGFAQDGNVIGKVVDKAGNPVEGALVFVCLLYTSPSPRDS